MIVEPITNKLLSKLACIFNKIIKIAAIIIAVNSNLLRLLLKKLRTSNPINIAVRLKPSFCENEYGIKFANIAPKILEITQFIYADKFRPSIHQNDNSFFYWFFARQHQMSHQLIAFH